MRSHVPFRARAVAIGALLMFMAAPAVAQDQLKLDQVGAALAFPLLAGEAEVCCTEIETDPSQAITYITITNVGPTSRNLHFSAISGSGWNVTDFDCPVTASETVLITFAPIGRGTSLLSMECNQATGLPIQIARAIPMNGEEGVLFVTNETHECKDGTCTTTENDLFGDFVVVNPEQGYAWSAGAIPFQGLDPLAPGVADRDYHFDNSEYAMFPATVAANFIAPGRNGTLNAQVVGAELFLFTLDGRANIGSQAALDIVFYDDDETPTSAHYTFECSTIVKLTDINPNFAAAFLGSDAGHFYATAIDADQFSNVHDAKFGNGNAIRVVGVHGWLFQSIQGIESPVYAAWGRSLSQGMLPQDLDGNDVPTFDGL